MDKNYILTLDQSTSGTKALVIDRAGQVIAKSSIEHQQFYPKPGWVEHDPIMIYNNVKIAAQEALERGCLRPDQLAALTITNQRETAMMWDRRTGLPVHRAIVWQCQRTAETCAKYKEAGHESLIHAKTGLMLDPYFSASKWSWLLEEVDGARELVGEGNLLIGTIDSWLIWKLTRGKVHATDVTNASRTSLFNIHTLQWDEELCQLFHVPLELLPEVRLSDELYGYTEDQELFDAQIPITGVIGDSQAALFGQLCLQPGMAKATYGTGTSLLMNVGDRPATGRGLVSAIAWGREGKVTYALEAVIRTSGDSIKWLKDQLKIFSTYEEMNELLAAVPDNEGVYLVPAFGGLGSPYWDADARAAITGMNRGTGRGHMIRAALESIAYQVRDAAEQIRMETGIALQELRVDGGASDNPVLMQFQADILDRTVAKSEVAELSAMGSAYLGGLGIGVWSSTDEIAGLPASYRKFEAMMEENVREKLCEGWKRAVASVMNRRYPGWN